MINANRLYSRSEIEKEFKKVKSRMHIEAKKLGKKYYGEDVAYFEDVYTGEIYKGGDRYEYEHIRSSENIFTKYKSTHTDKEIALIANCTDNVAVTSFEINRHKDKYQIEERILNDPAKILKFKINVKLTESNVKKADETIMKVASELLKNRKNVC